MTKIKRHYLRGRNAPAISELTPRACNSAAIAAAVARAAGQALAEQSVGQRDDDGGGIDGRHRGVDLALAEAIEADRGEAGGRPVTAAPCAVEAAGKPVSTKPSSAAAMSAPGGKAAPAPSDRAAPACRLCARLRRERSARRAARDGASGIGAGMPSGRAAGSSRFRRSSQCRPARIALPGGAGKLLGRAPQREDVLTAPSRPASASGASAGPGNTTAAAIMRAALLGERGRIEAVMQRERAAARAATAPA